tara:strand:+ start:1323 stop:1535 length:213 start_codon:yes stop_codon:yes gene_type:complete
MQTRRNNLISKLKPLEKKGKIKVNYDTGEVELLGKNPEENKEILNKFMFSDPKTCLNVMQKLYKEDDNDK